MPSVLKVRIPLEYFFYRSPNVFTRLPVKICCETMSANLASSVKKKLRGRIAKPTKTAELGIIKACREGKFSRGGEESLENKPIHESSTSRVAVCGGKAAEALHQQSRCGKLSGH